MKYFAFYGTLRKGHYNYQRCFLDSKGNLLPGIEFIKTIELSDQPFMMINLGHYPMLLKSDKNYPLIVDILKIDNPKVENFVDAMETGAGYEKKTIKVPLESDMIIACNIYVGEAEIVPTYYNRNNPIITSGDWNKKDAEKLKNDKS